MWKDLAIIVLLAANCCLYLWPRKKVEIKSSRCHAYDGIIKDWQEKDRIIHRLEKRIFRLKRANRNLREIVRAGTSRGASEETK
jgi:hypothetical protein